LALPLILLLCLLLFLPFLPSQSLAGKRTAYFFLLDTSLSMIKGEWGSPFKKAQAFMLRKAREAKIGDIFVVFTFDEKVTEMIHEEIKSEEVRDEVAGHIRDLEARGPWTWASKALETLSRSFGDLGKRYGWKRGKIYLLTDGKNDPPPYLKEEPVPLSDLMVKYFSGYDSLDAYIYVLFSDSGKKRPSAGISGKKRPSAGISREEEPSAGISGKKRPSAGISREEEPSVMIGPGIILLSFTGPGRPMEISGTVSIEGFTARENVPIKLIIVRPDRMPEGTSSVPDEVTIEPSTFSAKWEGQEIPFTIRSKGVLPEGKYYGEVLLQPARPGHTVTPERIKFYSTMAPATHKQGQSRTGKSLGQFWTAEKREIYRWFMASLPVLALLSFFSYLSIFRRVIIWARLAESNFVLELPIYGWKKSYLKGFGLGNYYIQMDKFEKTAYLVNKKAQLITQVSHNSDYTCKMPDGRPVNIRIRFMPF
jgi:hypothetical protein